ncbi:MAG: LCP family protein [Lachnospiraceae bacterium]|nr:LCP family protein [Lachnospiraceae bacterium]
MSKNTDNEMARIQRGLEEFLEQEMASGNEGRKKSNSRREPQLYDLEEDWDSKENLKTRKQTGRANSGARQTGKTQYYKEKPEKKQNRKVQSGRKSAKKSEPNGDKKVKNDKRHAGKKKSAGKRLKRFLVVVVLIIALLGAGLYSFAGSLYQKMNYVEVESVADLPMKEDGVVNVLLIGNDSRENGDDGRSDAMILLSVSNRTKTIYMTSLLRDMYVEIPGHDNNRLNAAYSFGGAELLMETVEKNFEIPVNRYVQVNFEAFVGLVDSVGGVDLELTTEELEYVNGYLVEYNMLTDRPQGTDNMDTQAAGMVHLNGPQALAYCRNRYIGTDFGRTERQRKVLTEVIKKIPGALVTNGSQLFDTLLPNLTTNLTKNECISLGLMAGKALTYDIIADSIPQTGTFRNATIRKMSVLEVDFEANRKYLQEKLYGGQK